VAAGSPQELIREHSTREVVELRFHDGALIDVSAHIGDLADRIDVLVDRVQIYTDDGDGVAAAIHDAGVHPESVLVRRSSLEDVFLRLTGRMLID
jgi:lipooligosaccharide transport system ATP-binding protein